MSSPAHHSLIRPEAAREIQDGVATDPLWGYGRSAETSFVLSSENAKMQQIRRICETVAPLDEPLLLLGESGTGKEVLARYVHSKSGRGGPFVKVNCAATPFDLLESEFFGHERGAFTGAHTGRPGKFALADKGTLLLDEVGEMPVALQTKLLHVLQDGEYTRIGGTRRLFSQARVIAATNIQIQRAVTEGKFREDLFFRLNVITVDVPPLRDRREDITAFCNHFLNKHRSKFGSTLTQLPQELIDAFHHYHWPGNVRQLENAVKRYLILGDLSSAIAEVVSVGPRVDTQQRHISLKHLSASAAETAERELVLRTLNEVNWNRKLAAQRLGVCYKSLLNKLRRWQIKTVSSHI